MIFNGIEKKEKKKVIKILLVYFLTVNFTDLVAAL